MSYRYFDGATGWNTLSDYVVYPPEQPFPFTHSELSTPTTSSLPPPGHRGPLGQSSPSVTAQSTGVYGMQNVDIGCAATATEPPLPDYQNDLAYVGEHLQPEQSRSLDQHRPGESRSFQELRVAPDSHVVPQYGPLGGSTGNSYTHPSSVEPRLKCGQCGKSYKNQNSFRKHYCVTGVAKKAFECLMCDQTFTLPKDLKRHTTNVHDKPNQEKYKCDRCGREISGRRDNYRRHRKDQHGITDTPASSNA